jgi:hypothetical protein
MTPTQRPLRKRGVVDRPRLGRPLGNRYGVREFGTAAGCVADGVAVDGPAGLAKLGVDEPASVGLVKNDVVRGCLRGRLEHRQVRRPRQRGCRLKFNKTPFGLLPSGLYLFDEFFRSPAIFCFAGRPFLGIGASQFGLLGFAPRTLGYAFAFEDRLA